MGRIVLIVMGILWVLFGVLGLISPAVVGGGLGIELPTADAVTDVRAIYGGLQIGIGLYFFYCSRSAELIRPGLIALALIAAGFGVGRSFGILVDGARGGLIFFALTIEVIAFALAWISLRREGAATHA